MTMMIGVCSVSIHAPVKGRRAISLAMEATSPVSIHAPVKGRPTFAQSCPLRLSFNPRPREGATGTDKERSYWQEVSIHAPVKGRPS